jgi:hypothetical protein
MGVITHRSTYGVQAVEEVRAMTAFREKLLRRLRVLRNISTDSNCELLRGSLRNPPGFCKELRSKWHLTLLNIEHERPGARVG